MVNTVFVSNSIDDAIVCLDEAIAARILMMGGPDPISDLWSDSVHQLRQCARVIRAAESEYQCQQADAAIMAEYNCPEVFN